MEGGGRERMPEDSWLRLENFAKQLQEIHKPAFMGPF